MFGQCYFSLLHLMERDLFLITFLTRLGFFTLVDSFKCPHLKMLRLDHCELVSIYKINTYSYSKYDKC